MTLNRRELLRAGAVAASLSAGALSACTPADIVNVELPGRFFAAIKSGSLAKAKEWAASDVSLAISSTAGNQLFEGPADVVGALDRLFRVEGFSMIGDSDEGDFGGMYWRELGPWLCSDMLKGGAIDFAPCFDPLSHSVFNVMVIAEFATGHVGTILLVESRHLMAQLSVDPRPIEIKK